MINLNIKLLWTSITHFFDSLVSVEVIHGVLEWRQNASFDVESPRVFVVCWTQIFNDAILEGETEWTAL